MTKHTQKLDLRNSMNSENEVPIQHTYGDCVKICDQRHNSGTYWHKVCKHWCNNTNFSYSQPHSQEVTLSEKLAATADNLSAESIKLSLMADAIHALDTMYL